MNFAKAYQDSVKPISPEDKEKKSIEQSLANEKDPARLQLIHNWMQSTVTQEMIADINDNEQGLITLAIQCAISYPQTNNHQTIIQLLTRVDTLRKLKETYATSK